MASIRPFDGFYVDPERALEVVSPPYDALTPEQRHEYASNHPWNYLNVMRSLEEFPESERPTLESLMQENNARLQALIDSGRMVNGPPRAFYLYRLTEGEHSQTGVVCESPVLDYEQGLIKKHEHTQASKEDDLVHYLDVVGAISSPICLAYPAQAAIDACIERLTQAEPLLEFVSEDDVAQSIWVVDDPADIDELQSLFAAVPAAYLTDGHHRAAATARIAQDQSVRNPDHTGEEPYNFLLVAYFPDDQLRILEYNRCVDDLDGRSVDDFLASIEPSFTIEKLNVDNPEQARPAARGQIAMFLDGHWYRLTARSEIIPQDDPVDSLDVALLQDHVFDEALGIDDPRSDPRLHYVSAAFSLTDLEKNCRERGEVAFAVYPTSIADLMAVADAGEVMPPKSTWFDPKLRSGIFLRLR